MRESFRTGLNVACGAFMSLLYVMVGRHLIETQILDIWAPWCAFLLCAFACTWVWVCLASCKPDAYTTRLKEVAWASSISVLSLFGALALGITVVRLGRSDLTVASGHALIALGIAVMPWMLKKLRLI